jgi:hypothetical protein
LAARTYLLSEEALYQRTEHLISEEFAAKGEGDNHKKFSLDVGRI